MRWKHQTYAEWSHEVTQWRRWFAWRPVVMHDQWVWLEIIERRADPNLPASGATQYRSAQ